MSRSINDGRGRLGGRTKGTPNKTPVSQTEWISGLIDRNRKKYEEDLRGLDPIKRVEILTCLICSQASPLVVDPFEMSGSSESNLTGEEVVEYV